VPKTKHCSCGALFICNMLKYTNVCEHARTCLCSDCLSPTHSRITECNIKILRRGSRYR